jgi:hypothetical protein
METMDLMHINPRDARDARDVLGYSTTMVTASAATSSATSLLPSSVLAPRSVPV